ncbi:hypothetical protein Godav_021598 [Gossypium davidsonii]|uniref:Hydroxyproline-rich glycoprotein family protein n=1 Tax=Gossypium davidsonii TaxID=34287 RepID=A0A7J8R7I0_GOSDV|nr:hypothetical protein [Gossypium davidsonii]
MLLLARSLQLRIVFHKLRFRILRIVFVDETVFINIYGFFVIIFDIPYLPSKHRELGDLLHKRRWSGWWSVYWCFGSNKQKKRIGPAVLVSETSASGGNVPAAENPNQASSFTLPFVAPPSSPASFLPSGPPSATQSPAGLVSLTSISASMYSPGPASIFAIGPYAHETQLVSPPVFSAFPTEPSTAPFTPPPESVHLTTPSSPEVPFAQFLGPNLQYGEQRFPLSHYEFQSYHLQPGSPVGQLISPSSGISGSGTSSPFLDGDYTTGLRFPEFQLGYPSKLLNLDKLSNREWGSYHGSGTLTPDGTTSTPRNGFLLDHQISEIVSHPRMARENQTDQVVVNHRVSFELTNQKAASCVETETATPSEAVAESLWSEAAREREENATKLLDTSEYRVGETCNVRPEKAPAVKEAKPQHHKNRSITLGSAKEFNFDNLDGGDVHNKPIVSSDWWANEKVAGNDDGIPKNWSFFPMLQPGVS